MRPLRAALVAVCVSAAAISVTSAAETAAAAGSAPTTGLASGTMVAGTMPVWDAATGTERYVAAADAKRIISSYWTPERMKAATPASAPEPTAAQDAKSQSRRATPPAPEQIDAPMAPQVPAGGGGVQDAAFSHTTGKIYFLDDGAPKWCSGSAATGTNRRLILTAAHCVHQGPGGSYHENWYFLPGYSYGTWSHGEFWAYHVWFWSAWTSSRDRHYDYSFVVAWNNQFGQRVVDAVGGHGLVSNAGRPFVHVAGYPGNRDGGEGQWYCWGTTSRRSLINSDQELGCPWTGGFSGGPWLRDYNHTNGLGYAISVGSYTLDGSGPPIFGPYFDGDMFTLRNSANADVPPA